MSEPSQDRDPFEAVAESFLARYRAGEHPSITDYAARYPELADQIRRAPISKAFSGNDQDFAGIIAISRRFSATAELYTLMRRDRASSSRADSWWSPWLLVDIPARWVGRRGAV
jgi:hypothetical protein